MIATRRAVLAGLAALPVAARAGETLDAGAARAGRGIDAALAAFPPRDEQRRALTALREAGTPGALHLSDGARWYALMLQRGLGTITPEEAQRRLSVELVRLLAQAQALFASLGLPRGTAGEGFSALWSRDLYADDAAGREHAVADMARALDRQRARATRLVGPLPPAALAVTVRALSADEIAAGKGGYRILPTAGVPGGYVVDLKDIRRRPAWTLPSVVAHELLPGHMAQLPIEALTPPSPERTEYAAAFVEGWGIHAETLAAADGAFASPLEKLGHLHWLIFRTGRGLVDLGIHLCGWSLADARARLTGWQGEPAYFAPFDADLQRIAVEPGVRAAEALAWLGIADRMRGREGRALAGWHRAVLAGGRKRLEQLP